MFWHKFISSFKKPPRILEQEAILDMDEVRAYDGLVSKYMGILHEGFVATLLSIGPSHGNVLEVGTGTGRISITLAKHTSKYAIYAIDLSQNMLMVARENAQHEGVIDRITFLPADACNLPFEDNTFHMVYSHNMMHHLPDPEPMLLEMARVLRPEGAFVVRDLKRLPPFWRWIHVNLFGVHYDPIMKRQYRDSISAAFSVDEWKTLATQFPLEDIHISRQFVTHISIHRPFLGEKHKKTKLPLSLKTIPRSLYTS